MNSGEHRCRKKYERLLQELQTLEAQQHAMSMHEKPLEMVSKTKDDRFVSFIQFQTHVKHPNALIRKTANPLRKACEGLNV